VGNSVKKRTVGQPSGDREKTKDVLLRVAIAAIEEVGEAHVRLDDILRDADASVSSLYHHYGNMRGLLDEAQLARFDSHTGQNIRAFHDAVIRVRNKDEFRELIAATVKDLFSRERKENRSTIVNAFGSIFKTPEFDQRVVELEGQNIAVLSAALEHAKSRGLTRSDLDAVSFSAWAIGLTFSRVIPDIINDDDIIDGWIDLTIDSINHLLGL
jgi:AcrR family transcriptional regulator